MAKLTENSFRDVNIAFANELSVIADELGIDVFELIELANKHPRVNILQPGPGVGGHCIAVDPWFIVSAVPEDARLIRTAREVNDHKPECVLGQGRASAPTASRSPVIAALGLAFKPDIDDLRESPGAGDHQAAGRSATRTPRVLAVEPNIEELPAVALAAFDNVDPGRHDRGASRRPTSSFCSSTTRSSSTSTALCSPRKSVIDTRGVWR